MFLHLFQPGSIALTYLFVVTVAVGVLCDALVAMWCALRVSVEPQLLVLRGWRAGAGVGFTAAKDLACPSFSLPLLLWRGRASLRGASCTT